MSDFVSIPVKPEMRKNLKYQMLEKDFDSYQECLENELVFIKGDG